MFDVENNFRMPKEVCFLNSLPVIDYRKDEISDRNTYLSLCQFYDKFKLKHDEYINSNWVPEKEEYKINFGVHYPCYKNDRATYECLLSFRTIYPDVPVVLISDNGNDFSEIAKYFNCKYIHEKNRNGNGVTNVLKGTDNINLWLQRIKNTCDILSEVDYILYMEDDVLTRDIITKNPNADLSGPSNPDDFWWSPQLIQWIKENRPTVEINGLNGCGGTIFNRKSFLECLENLPDYQEFGKLDDRITWASDVLITFLFLYNNKVSRRWLDHSEETRGKIFGSTSFDHQFKYFYNKKWSPYYLKNIELDNRKNFIFTACSDNIFKDQFVPFFASLKEHTSFDGTLVVIDYGLSNKNLKILTDNGVRVIPSVGKYEIVSDRFVSIDRYIKLLNDPDKIFIHYDCDVWFEKDINHIFDLSRKFGKSICTKDVWHCGFLHDCVGKEEHKEYNRNILFEVEKMCGKVLQAGFICGNTEFWGIFNGYLNKLLLNGYLKNVFGTDELILNLLYYYIPDKFDVTTINYNTLPQWGIVDIDGKLIATDFHTDSKLSLIPEYKEEVIAIHLSSAARNKKEFEHTDFKIRYKSKYQKYLDIFAPKNQREGDKMENIITRLGYRRFLPKLLDELGCKIVCEVGVQYGNNLFNMAENSKVEEIWGVDMWRDTNIKSQNDIGLNQSQLDDAYLKVVERSKNNKKIKIIKGFSDEICKTVLDEYFDLVYIDADHSYEGAMNDLECWWSKVKTGGIFSGDDFVDVTLNNGVKFGVIQAVTEFVKKYNLEDDFINTLGKDNHGSSPQWFIIKKSKTV